MTKAHLVVVAILLALLVDVSRAGEAIDCASDPDQLQIRQYTTADGLPLDTVYSLAQDLDGFLWIGTEDGLARFDGSQTQILDLDEPLAGAPAFVERLTLTDDGDLLAGVTSSGLLAFESARPDRVSLLHSVDSPIHALEEIDSGVVLGARGHGLILIEAVSGAVGHLERSATGGGSVNAVAARGQGGLWIGYEGEGVQWFDGRDFHDPVIAGLDDGVVDALFEDGQGRLWVGTRRGLLRVENGRLDRLEHGRILDGNSHITVLKPGSGDTLWIGTADNGLLRYCDGRFETVGSNRGLGRSIINDVIEDREGSVWVATGGNGIYQLLHGAAHGVTTDSGLPDFPVLPIIQADDGSMWLGTFGGGVAHIDGDNVRIIDESAGLDDPRVLSLASAAGSDIWVGTRTGLYRIRPDAEGYSVTRPVPDIDQPVGALLAEPGGLWLGMLVGLIKLDIDADGGVRQVHHLSAPEGEFGAPIINLFRDHNDIVWIGTDGGGLYHTDNGIPIRTHLENQLPSQVILDMLEAADGTLWLTTNRGLVRKQGETVHVFGTRHGLPEAHIFSILEDQSGHLWFSGNRGVFRVATSEFDAVADGRQATIDALTFDQSDGMPRTETNGGFHPPAWQSRNGRLWYPTMDGAAVFDPQRIGDRLSAPHPVNRQITSDRAISFVAEQVRLEPRPQRVEFRYSAPTFIRPQHIEYRYRLRGFEDGWYVTRDRTAIYRKLGPGTYHFEVQSRQAGGPWSRSLVNELAIEHHWTENRLLWLATAIVALAALTWLALQFLRARTLRWERIAQKQKLEAIGLMAGGIAHDFNNVLTGIFQGTERLSDQLPEGSRARQDAEAILEAAEGGAELTRQLLKFARRQSVEPAWIEISHQLASMQPFIDRMLPKSTTMEWSIEEDVGWCLIDPVQLQQVLLNLCVNARDAMQGEGRIRIRLEQTAAEAGRREHHRQTTCARISVSDTGPGMSKAIQQRAFEPFFTTKEDNQGTGLGLAVTHAIVRSAGGWITIDSHPGKGTVFHIWLPVHCGDSPPKGD